MTKTACPHCGARLNLKNAGVVGKEKSCPRCKQKFVVRLLTNPRPDAGSTDVLDVKPPDQPFDTLPAITVGEQTAKQKPATRKTAAVPGKSKSTVWIVASIGGLFAMIVLIGGYVGIRSWMGPQPRGDDSAAITEAQHEAATDDPPANLAGQTAALAAKSPEAPGTETPEAADEAQVRNDLAAVGLAMHKFHDTFKAMPGSDRQRDDGPRGLSWRVHILPYLEQQQLYEQFALDEPWDSPHNAS